MTKNEILARTEELLNKRGSMLEEVLNTTEGRKVEIYAWFDAMRKELKALLKEMQECD